MFRWGVLSTAKIGREQVIPSLQDSDNGIVTAIASRDYGRARTLADRFGAPHAFGTYEELLLSKEVDGVYIPLPTSQHIEWSVQAAIAGKHVLCEKPIALHADEISALVSIRDEHKVLVSEAYMVNYHPQWAKVQDLIENGAIGALRHVQGAFCYNLLDPENMRNRPELGGGGLPDIGVYPTVSTRLVTGKEPLRVQATIERDPEFGTDRYASVKADFGTFELSFYCATQLALRQHMAFHGAAGFIEVTAPFNAGDYGHATVILHNQTHSGAETFRFPGVRQYKLMAETFARAAHDKSLDTDRPIFTLENSILNQKMIDAVYRAGDADGWVAV